VTLERPIAGLSFTCCSPGSFPRHTVQPGFKLFYEDEAAFAGFETREITVTDGLIDSGTRRTGYAGGFLRAYGQRL